MEIDILSINTSLHCDAIGGLEQGRIYRCSRDFESRKGDRFDVLENSAL